MSESCDCGKESKLGATVQFHCQNCSTITKKFSVKNPLKAAAIATLLAFSSSQFLGYAVTDNRYPLSTEYELLNACVSSSKSPLTGYQYAGKKEVCLCALEDTMNDISHIRYVVNESAFLSAFRKNAGKCR